MMPDFQDYFDRIAHFRERGMHKEAFHHIGAVLCSIKEDTNLKAELVQIRELLSTLSGGVWYFFYSAKGATEDFGFSFISEMDELSAHYIDTGRNIAAFNLWNMLASTMSGTPRTEALNRLIEFDLTDVDQGFYESLFDQYGEAFSEYYVPESELIEDFENYFAFAANKKLSNHQQKFSKILESARDCMSGEDLLSLLRNIKKKYNEHFGFDLDFEFSTLCIEFGYIFESGPILSKLIHRNPKIIEDSELVDRMVYNYIKKTNERGLYNLIDTALTSYGFEYDEARKVWDFIQDMNNSRIASEGTT